MTVEVLMRASFLRWCSTRARDTARDTAADVPYVITFDRILILNIMRAILLHHLAVLFSIEVLLSKWSTLLVRPL